MEAILSRLESTSDTLSSIDEAHLRSLATKIDLQIDSLDSERASLVSQRKRCQVFLSPLRRFPNELLGEIFSWVVTEDPGFEVPMKLSQICKHWREVVLNSPDLWTNLVFPLDADETFEEQETTMLEALATRVQRAQNQPMSLSLKWKPQFMPQLLTMIHQATSSVRWKSINLHSGPFRELRPFFERLLLYPEIYTSVTTLDITGHSKSNEIIPGGIDILPLVNLRGLSIDLRNKSSRIIDTARIPWPQLTSLTMTTELTSFRYLGVLRECINLVSCSIEPDDIIGPSSDEDKVDTTEKVCLPHLRQLKLHHTGEMVPLYMLVPLVAPLLEEFAFSFDSLHFHKVHEASDLYPGDLDIARDALKFFSVFINNHAKSLKKLSVPGAFTSSQWDRRTNPFDNLDGLRRLHITPPYSPYTVTYSSTSKNVSYHDYDDQSTMSFLIPGREFAMPMLERFELVNHPFLSEQCQALLDTVISRRCPGQGDLAGPRNLRHIVLGFWDADARIKLGGLKRRLKASASRNRDLYFV